jgi:hypothetical protein
MAPIAIPTCPPPVGIETPAQGKKFTTDDA